MSMTCPNCGHPLPENARTVVMLTCPSCDTTLYLQSDRLLTAGSAGEMHDGPALFSVGDAVKLGRRTWHVLGHARFSYGRGWWDEYWCEDDKARGTWVSVDEGDIICQEPLDVRLGFGVESAVGEAFEFDHEGFRVIETGEGACIALRGQFGERLTVGDRFAYANAQGDQGTLLSCERDGEGTGYFIGTWFDPFDIEVKVLGEAQA